MRMHLLVHVYVIKEYVDSYELFLKGNCPFNAIFLQINNIHEVKPEDVGCHLPSPTLLI